MLRNCYKALCFLGHGQAGLGAGRRLGPIHHRGDGQCFKKYDVLSALVTIFGSFSVLVEFFQQKKPRLFK